MSASDNLPMPDLLRRLREGDSRAAQQLYARYVQRLLRVAQRQLSQRLGSRFDEEDVVQSAFRSFFRREARGDFQIDCSSQLWRLLASLTVMKARAKARQHTAEKRDIHAEAVDGDAAISAALVGDPSPDEAAILADQIDLLLRELPNMHGEVLRMRLDGHSVADIARAKSVSRQTVYRVLQLLQERLMNLG